jgi:lysophospholipase L1-like esterase
MKIASFPSWPVLAAGLLAVTVAAAAPVNTAIEPVPLNAKWLKLHEGFVQIARRGGVNVLFLGDSITDLWRYDVLGGSQRGKAIWDRDFAPLHAANFGIAGDRTQHVLWRIEHGELDGISPKVVVLLIGTNNTGTEPDGRMRNSTPEIIAGVTAVVREIRIRLPRTKILLFGIFPRGKKDDPRRGQIAQINAAIARLDDGTHVHFLDIGREFLEPDGTLSTDIMPDLLHPNARGFQIWADAIKGPLASLMKGTGAAP